MKALLLFSFLFIQIESIHAQENFFSTSLSFSADREEFVHNIRLLQPLNSKKAYVHTSNKKIHRRVLKIPEVKIEALNSKNIEEILLLTQKKKTSLLFFSGHGTFVSSINSRKYSKEEILHSFHFPLKKNISLSSVLEVLPEKGILVTSQCYGGSLNFTTFDRPGTCSAAAVPWWRVGYSRPGSQGSLYIQGFSGELIKKEFDFDKDNRTNLLEAHLAGMFLDSDNAGYGELSSWTYLDYKLCGSGFSFSSSLTKQTLGITAPDCIDSAYIRKASLAGGFHLKEHLQTSKVPLLSTYEVDLLPNMLALVYENFRSKGYFGRQKNQAIHYTSLTFLSFLHKYLKAIETLTTEELQVLNDLIRCETTLFLN